MQSGGVTHVFAAFCKDTDTWHLLPDGRVSHGAGSRSWLLAKAHPLDTSEGSSSPLISDEAGPYRVVLWGMRKSRGDRLRGIGYFNASSTAG